jgi:hypothetical protein
VELTPLSETINSAHHQEGAIPRRYEDNNGASKEHSDDANKDAKTDDATDEDPNSPGLTGNILGDKIIQGSKGNGNDSDDGTKDESHDEYTNLEHKEEQDATKNTSTSGNSKVDPVSELGKGGENIIRDEEQDDESCNEEDGLQKAISSKAPNETNENRRGHNSDLDPSKDGRINVNNDIRWVTNNNAYEKRQGKGTKRKRGKA